MMTTNEIRAAIEADGGPSYIRESFGDDTLIIARYENMVGKSIAFGYDESKQVTLLNSSYYDLCKDEAYTKLCERIHSLLTRLKL